MSQYSTPSNHFLREETKGVDMIENHLYENLKCDTHPTFKLDALCVNEELDEVRMMCIKCIIAGENYSIVRGDKLITIKELIEKCADNVVYNNDKVIRSRESLQDKFVSFITKDHIGQYNNHLEAQYEILDNEINDIIGKLEDIRGKFKEQLDKEKAEINKSSGEIRESMRVFLDENPDNDGLRLKSMHDINEQLQRISNKEELQDVMKKLYFRSKERIDVSSQGPDHKTTLNAMEDLRIKVEEIKNQELDLTRLADFKESLNFALKTEDYPLLRSKAYKPMFGGQQPQYHHEQQFMLGGQYPAQHLKYTPEDGHYQMNPHHHSHDRETQPFISPAETINKMHNEDTTHKFKSLENEASTEKKRRRIRFPEIDSHSLRNLTKTFDHRDYNDQNNLKNKAIGSLNDWINRRITGYLVFQNTINNNPIEVGEKSSYKEMGFHMNKLTGQKWKNLTEEEREEYRDLAKDFRKGFRKEIEEYENYEDVTDLIEKLDHRIKKIKKE